jgi:hypothetical protein
MVTALIHDPALLTGSWRLAKIKWHDHCETVYGPTDNWQQYYFKPDGTYHERYRFNNKEHLSHANQKWHIDGHEIILHTFGKPYYKVELLQREALILKILIADIRWCYRRVG